jgi:hypothetical protein
MKKITFFSRCELVHLYGRITPYLENYFEINHLAFSKVEQEILTQKYNIKNVVCLKDELEKFYLSGKVDSNIIIEIDDLIIKESLGEFCLNGSIQSDRTFEFYSYPVILHLCQSYYLFWKNYFNEVKPNYLIHEPVALFMTQIASYVLSVRGGVYLTNIQVIGDFDFNWIFVKGNNGELFNSNKEKLNLISNNDVKNFIDKFREKKSSILFSQYSNLKSRNRNFRGLKFLKLLGSILNLLIKSTFQKKIKVSSSPLDHIDTFLLKFRPKTLDQIRMRIDRFFFLTYDDFDQTRKFYYYPIHMEPESTVLYWGSGYYKNQVKLIENIAAQLPPDVFLYVKDHPHGIGDRNYLDYKRIKSIPNVSLIDPQIPGVEVIKYSTGVITINGTGGFESYLLGKACITFGCNFYTNMFGILNIKHIKNLRGDIYDNTEIDYYNDSNYLESIKLFLSQSNYGFTDYFSDYVQKTKINESENAQKVANGFINRLS